MKFKSMVAGFIMGSLCMGTVSVFAEGNLVSATVSNVLFKFDGKAKTVSSDYEAPALVYQDRVYVPARFIAEALGAKVEWQGYNNTINITSPEPIIKEVVKTVEVVKEPEQKNTDYKQLPITETTLDYEVNIQEVITANHYTRIYLDVKNKIDKPLLLQQNNTVVKVDGVNYSMEDVDYIYKDNRWYDDIRKDGHMQGYITISEIPKNSKDMQLSVQLEYNDGSKQTKTLDFNIKLSE
jgi:hypothetical protein